MLNYELNDDQHDGEEPSFHYIHSPNSKRTRLVGKGSLNKSLRPKEERRGQSQHSTSSDDKENDSSLPTLTQPDIKRQDSFTDETGSIDHSYGQPRLDKSGNSRTKQRARKLQLDQIDWYGRSRSTPSDPPLQQQTSLEDFIRAKSGQRGRVASGRPPNEQKG